MSAIPSQQRQLLSSNLVVLFVACSPLPPRWRGGLKPTADDLIALDLESTDGSKHMSFDDARVFIKRVKEKTGRYPLIYANNEVTKAITAQYAADETFSQRHLSYAHFWITVTGFRSKLPP